MIISKVNRLKRRDGVRFGIAFTVTGKAIRSLSAVPPAACFADQYRTKKA
jgi:hypothetical protein